MKRILLILIGLVFSLAPICVDAAGVSPVKYDDIQLDPGESVYRQITVMNTSEVSQTYYFKALNFSAANEEGKPLFRDDKIGLSQWITTSVESVTLAPGETQEVTVFISAPQNAEPGGHYASLFVTTNPPTQEELERGVGLGSNVGVLFLVKISGEIIEQAEVLEFGLIEEESLSNRTPIAFYSRIKNGGNVHFKPAGQIVITNFLGQKVAEISANPEEGNILPKSIRKFYSTWNQESLDLQTGNFWQELKNEFTDFHLGRYTAYLQMEWSNSQERLESSVTFWIIPWRALIVIFLALVVFVVLLKLYNKLIVARAQRKK